MSWKKMDSELKNVALQELACFLIGLLACFGLGYVSGMFLPHKIPAGVRYILSFLFSWNVIIPFLVKRVAHRGIDVDERLKRL